MNAITKLTAAALGAMSIAGGVAVAQSANDNPNDGRAQTADYGTPPGAPLKRDGSLHADPVVKAPVTSADTSSTTRTTTSTTNWNNPPAAAPVVTEPAAAAPAPAVTTDTSSTAYTRPRADRN